MNEASSRSLSIGVFDSGVGGLTVARAILRRVPGVRLLYLADTAHVPYGPRPLEQVRDFAVQIMEFLFKEGADVIVTGCNMSVAAGAAEAGRERFPQPIFEIVQPGARAAHAASRSGVIGVIATQGTVNSGVYGRRLRELGVKQVYEQACPKFVPLVERGLADGPEVIEAVAEYLTPLRDAGIDTLVFGCTHYPYLREAIHRFLGDSVTLIDPGEHVTEDLLATYGAIPGLDVTHRFFCSGDPESLQREGGRFLGIPLTGVEHVDVPVERR